MQFKLLKLLPLGACVLLAGCNSPKAVDDTVAVQQDTSATFNVLANDLNPEGNPLMVKKVWGAEKGTVTVNPDNTLTYTPKAGMTGSDTFQYRMKDNQGHASNALVKVDITPRPAVAAAPPPPVQLVPPPEVRTIVVPAVVSSTPPPTNSSPPSRVYGATEPVISQGPFVQSVFLTLHTTSDDKNLGEPVRVIIRRGNEILADRTVGTGELWGAFTDNSFEVPLSPQPPKSDLPRLVLDIRKGAVGSPNGGGWSMQAEVRARMSDGSTATVLPMTDQVKMGDDAPSSRSWMFTAPK
jgi:hypothetical protein